MSPPPSPPRHRPRRRSRRRHTARAEHQGGGQRDGESAEGSGTRAGSAGEGHLSSRWRVLAPGRHDASSSVAEELECLMARLRRPGSALSSTTGPAALTPVVTRDSRRGGAARTPAGRRTGSHEGPDRHTSACSRRPPRPPVSSRAPISSRRRRRRGGRCPRRPRRSGAPEHADEAQPEAVHDVVDAGLLRDRGDPVPGASDARRRVIETKSTMRGGPKNRVARRNGDSTRSLPSTRARPSTSRVPELFDRLGLGAQHVGVEPDGFPARRRRPCGRSSRAPR